ncbi:MAG: DUF1614 domain-containing protein [Planctomycetota bacterium]
MRRLGCLTLGIALTLAAILPVFFPNAMGAGLAKLGLSPDTGLLLLLAMLVGGTIHVPLWRLPADRFLRTDPLAVFGLAGALPRLERRSREAVVALNVGGGVLPLALAGYEVVRLASGAVWEGAVESPAERPSVPGVLVALALATALNAAVSYRLARRVPGTGFVVPGIVPAIVAMASALFLAADAAAPVMLASGVLGTLVGTALRLRHLRRRPIGLASIGGGGAFDAIVLVVVLSALLK